MKSLPVRPALLAVAALLFFSAAAFSAEWQVPEQWKFLKFAGGAAAGSFTPLTAKISELINKNSPGVNAG